MLSGRSHQFSVVAHEEFVEALHESPEMVSIDAPAWSVPLVSMYLTEAFFLPCEATAI